MDYEITSESLTILEGEFKKLLSEMIAKNESSDVLCQGLPKASEWSENELVVFALYRIAQARGLIIKMISSSPFQKIGSERPVTIKSDKKRIAKKAESDWMYDFLQGMAKKLTPSTLTGLYVLYADIEAVQRIMLCWIDYLRAVKELNIRLEQSPTGKALFNLIRKGNTACLMRYEPHPLIDFLLSSLRKEKITSYRPEKEDNQDLKCIVIEKAWKSYRKIGDQFNKDSANPPVFSLPSIKNLNSMVKSTWDGWNERWWEEEFSAAHKFLISLFHGKKIKEKAHQALRDHFEKWKTQKRTGIELSMEGLREEIEKPTGKDKDSFQKVEKQDINALSYKMDGESVGVLEEIYKFVEKRWGSKAIRFLEAFQNEDEPTIEKASKKAGISRQTGQKYLKELKKAFNNK